MTKMTKDKAMVWLLTRNVIVLLVIVLGIGLFLVKDIPAYIKGVLLGGAISLVRIRLMEIGFKRAFNQQAHKASNYVKAHYFLRYIITFIVLFIGVTTPEINEIGLIIGLFLLKPAAYIQGRLEPQVPKDGSVEFLTWEEDEEEKSDFW